MATKTITVMPHPKVGNRVAVFDRSPEHPRDQGYPTLDLDGDGIEEMVEVVIHGADPKPCEVAETPVINDSIREERLIRLDATEARKAREAHEARLAERDATRGVAQAQAGATDARGRQVDARAAEKRAADAEAKAAKLETELAELRAKAEAQNPPKP